MLILYLISYIFAAFILADFLTGLFHWWEDRYGNPDWPILGKFVIKPNINHHKNPSEFTKGCYIKRNWTTLFPSLVLCILFFYYKYYFLSLVFLFASQSNEMHCWEHTKVNRFISLLQRNYILQNKKTHAMHHKRPYDTNYCVMTMIVNPCLNRLNFWHYLERAIYIFSGINPRPERTLY